MEENTNMSVADELETIAVRFVAGVESSLAAHGLDPFAWSSVTFTAPLHVSGADADAFYLDSDGRDHRMPAGFDVHVFDLGRSLDPDAVSIAVRIENTLDTVGEYGVSAELGYRTETGVLEYVSAPARRG